VMVYLQSPSVFHSLIVRSREPDTICLLSAEKETERMSLVWPTKRRVVTPVDSSHRRSVLSQDDDRAYAPSDEITCARRQLDPGAGRQTHAVGHDVRMAVQAALRVPICCLVPREVPDD
jgi:hypothetical protein